MAKTFVFRAVFFFFFFFCYIFISFYKTVFFTFFTFPVNIIEFSSNYKPFFSSTYILASFFFSLNIITHGYSSLITAPDPDPRVMR